MPGHPELEAEQAYVDRAYARLDQLRADAEQRLRSVLDQGRGGTHQFREERDVIVRTSLARLDQLDIGDQALCFGRIDRLVDAASGAPAAGLAPGAGPAADGGARLGVESFHIGRLGISGDDVEPLVVDWRAPVAEPFYRATGRDPMGLVLRRHLAAHGRRIVGIEDERFALDGRAASVPGLHTETVEANGARRGPSGGVEVSEDLDLGGPGALLAALEGPRTGFMRDIVSTIQREQDEIIRSPLPGVLVVQGGPGTGKTAVALHRAAYLLYTHRFPLERQGVLVIGPNPLFLRYIEHVLPSLGESGVTLSTINGIVHGVSARGTEPAATARLKGEARMATVVARAVRGRQRALRREARIPFGATVLRLGTDQSAAVVAASRRRPGTHNSRRRFVEDSVVRHLADQYVRTLERRGALAGGDGAEGEDDPDRDGFDVAEFGRAVRRVPEFADAVDRMWPRLSAEELLHDLFGARPLLAQAGRAVLSVGEIDQLVRSRRASLAEIGWTPADVALLDEARVLLGPRRGRVVPGTPAAEEPRSYGHIVVDEAQDLSPMQLRMVARRSLSGSITAIGDIGQATGPHAPGGWDEVTAHLPRQRPPRLVELSVSYRTPAEVVDVAARVLAQAAPALRPPVPVRRTGVAPRFDAVAGPDPESGRAARVAAVAAELGREVEPGTVAVLAPSSLVADLAVALDAAGVPASDPRRDGLGAPLSLLPVDLANGLEFDAVVVVEPAAIVAEAPQGLRSLYVALTRPTRRLAVVHARRLPPSLHP